MDTIILFARVLLGFVRLNNDSLIMFCRNVVVMMTGNPSYTTPSPTLPIVTTAVDLLNSSVQEAMTGDRIKISARRDARRGLIGLMRPLAAYVQGHCNDDVTTLLSSGFQASRRPSPPVLPPEPANPRLDAGPTSGTVVLRHKKSANAVNYTVQTAPNAAGPFTDYALVTSTRTVISDLTPGSTVSARARANGSLGASDWSSVVSRMVI
jgi:hypothetical protein